MKYETKDNKINIEFGTDTLNKALQTRTIAFLEILQSVQDVAYTQESKKKQDDAMIEEQRQKAIYYEQQARKNVENDTPIKMNIDEAPEEPSEQTVVTYTDTSYAEQELPPLEEPQQNISDV